MKGFSGRAKRAGNVIGFVPTMGYLHDGHLSLLKAAKRRCDTVVVSIFVNPIQFSPNEDLKKYPRDFKRDLKLLSPLKVDAVFAPGAEEMFPKGFSAFVEVPSLSDKLCGRSRPGHFRGVATVVSKLFNIVSPDIAFFGEKDFQQLVIIKRMVSDLALDVEVVGLPTVRERGGLAMSSRNAYLSAKQRAAASVLFRSLKLARDMVRKRVLDPKRIIKAMRDLISKAKPRVLIDYIEVCDPGTLETRKKVKGRTLVALAAFVKGTRLIDNIILYG